MFWQDCFNLREVLALAFKDERHQKMERVQKMVRASYVLNQLHVVVNAFDFWLSRFVPVPYGMTDK